jgi:hypothetical protein
MRTEELARLRELVASGNIVDRDTTILSLLDTVAAASGAATLRGGAMKWEIVKYFAQMLAKVALESEGVENDRDAEARLAEAIMEAVQTWLDVGERPQ